MDSELTLPAAKRLRTSLNGNLQVTECVREFKLPRQFPSMITKVSSDKVIDKNKLRTNFNQAVTCLNKVPVNTRIVMNKEMPANNLVRKIKLKGKDGRDLGEVNVQDLPQNIQGKTITLAKNGVIKRPEIISPNDKTKGITVGLLTPVNIVKTDKPSTTNFPSLTCLNRDKKETIDTANDNKKTVIIEQKQMSAVMDQQGRPQVLVFQSGKNWHMVKIAATGPSQIPQNGKNIVMAKLQNAQNSGKFLKIKETNQGAKEIVQSRCEKLIAVNKISGTNNSSMIVKRWTQSGTSDTIGERYKPKSPGDLENGDSRPKIEISRVFAPNNNVSVPQIENATKLSSDNVKHPQNTGNSLKSYTSLRKDVMVVMPSDITDSLGSDSESMITDNRPLNTKLSDSANVNSRKNIETNGVSTTRDIFSSRKTTSFARNDEGKNDEISSHLNILTEALSTVEDKELRARALKALADCGIGIERLVPICPPSDQRPVKDSSTQTHVFGIFEPEHFIYVNEEKSAIDRIRPIERKAPLKVGHIIGNPHLNELSLSNSDIMNWLTQEPSTELDAMIEGYCAGNEGASEVRNIITKPKTVPNRLVMQLEEDFQNYKKYDENGLLNIHRAVITDDLKTVTRLLKVLKACEESVDIPTDDGETSLELAVRYEVSPAIVKLLLEFGAGPTSPEAGHDSALIIASKKSLPILKDLVPYVTSRKTLDNYDSTGFAALHYCAQNDNKIGVIELARASADVNVRDRRSGRTPLFHAIENEHIELAQLLLDKGAQPNIASYSGHTVFALVEEGKHYNLAESLNRAGK